MAVTADFATLSLNGLDVVICLHTAKDPIPAEWQTFIDQLIKSKKKNGDTISRTRVLVVSDGGAPNAKQREMMAAAAGGPLKLGGITIALSNPLTRGIATAIGWVNPAFMAVAPPDWKDALQHLGLDGQIKPILFEYEKLQRHLAPVSTLALLNAQLKGSQ